MIKTNAPILGNGGRAERLVYDCSKYKVWNKEYFLRINEPWGKYDLPLKLMAQ